MNHLYQIPFHFKQLIPPPPKTNPFGEKEAKPVSCSLETSIDQYIRLLLSTPKGAFKYDPAFGNDLWEMDFINTYESLKDKQKKVDWEQRTKDYLKKNIETYETRLTNIEIATFKIDEEDKIQIRSYPKDIEIPKRTISIKLQAKIVANGKDFQGVYKLYMSPIFVQ